MSQFIAVVDRFEGDFAILKHKDHEILFPKEDLPENVKEGGFVTIIALSGESETKKQKEAETEAKKKTSMAFEEKDNKTKVSEVINDVIDNLLGVEPPIESPSEKQVKELKNISGKIEKMNKGINEEIEEHKSHEG